MGKIFCVMGKSSTGKDTIYKEIMYRNVHGLEKIVPYTTRPIRIGELEGREYHFTDESGYEAFEKAGKVIEQRVYQTVHGPWRYFTVDDGNISRDKNYIVIGTLEVYVSLLNYFGTERVCPIYVEVEDGERLTRALNREKTQENPKYEELCRRFIADNGDFSEEKLVAAGIKRRFVNVELDSCIGEITDYIGEAIS